MLSRLALLDIFLAFFMLLRRALPGRRPRLVRAGWPTASADTGRDAGCGPVRALLLRPWLLAAGVSFGLACGTKWAALYPLAAFGLLVVALERRAPGGRSASAGRVLRSLLVDGVPGVRAAGAASRWSSTSPPGPAG